MSETRDRPVEDREVEISEAMETLAMMFCVGAMP